MNKLSKREKGMLIMLGIVFGCAAIFMLVVKPIIDTAVANKAQITTLEDQLSTARVALERRPVIEKQLTDAINFVNENGKAFYNKMALWDAERHITKILYDNKIEYHSVSVTPAEPFNAGVLLGTADPAAAVDPNTPVELNGIERVMMVVECHTTRAKLTNLLDAFYSLGKKATITGWEYQVDEKTPEIKATLTFELFAIQ